MADRSPATDDNFDLLLFLWARRRLILGVTLLGMVAGIAAAFIIRPRFKSEVILSRPSPTLSARPCSVR
ncbi:MAG: hypothetical protein IPI07_11850 [Flavobacteriales bacterium]|nr:hypothetical protein [Flavobacteriales bacterium]